MMGKSINIDLNNKSEKNIKDINDTENIKNRKNKKYPKEQIDKKNEAENSNKNKFDKRNKAYNVRLNEHLKLDKLRNESHICKIDKTKGEKHIYEVDKIKKEAGITIITLAVTILIIIILASITINAVLGDNGLIRQAQLAKDMAENSIEEDTSQMNSLLQEYINLMAEDAEGGGITEPEKDTTPPTVTIMEEAITENSIAINVSANDPESGLANENAYVYYLNGNEQERNSSKSHKFEGLTASTSYTIKVEVYNGVGLKGEDSITVSTTAKPGLSADEIQQNPTAYYGAEVKGYTCSSNGVSKWRIFYAGPEPGGSESNIYLIADDYILRSAAPTSTVGNQPQVGSTDYRLNFRYIIDDYSGASWIISNTNSKAREWLSYIYSYPLSTNIGIKLAAYLMDTKKWSIYAGENAEYAIGGPTLELFCESYKDTHSSKYINNQVRNEVGYAIKWSNEGEQEYKGSIQGLAQDEFNEIYIKSDISKAEGMWLASPSIQSNSLFGAYYKRLC